MIVDPKNLFFEPLKNASSSVEMNVNGSSTAVEFYVTCPANRKLVLTRMVGNIVDGSMNNGLFAGIVGGALTNGVNIKIDDGNGNDLKDFTTGFGNIKLNPDWNLLTGVDGVISAAAGDDSLPLRWTIARSGASPLLKPGCRLVVTIQDDLTSIVRFRLAVHGYLL